MDKQIESGDTQNATSEAQSAIAAVLPAANSLAPSEVMDTFPLPIRTLVDESHELAARIGAFYQADPNSGRPGFESVAFRVPADTPQRMTNLVTAAREMVLICILGNATTQRGLRAEFEQAEKTLRTIKRTLAFYYDDGITTQEDEQLEALASEHVDETSSLANLSAALYDYGRMAQRDNEALAIIETWDKQLPELALQLSATLAGPAPEVGDLDV